MEINSPSTKRDLLIGKSNNAGQQLLTEPQSPGAAGTRPAPTAQQGRGWGAAGGRGPRVSWHEVTQASTCGGPWAVTDVLSLKSAACTPPAPVPGAEGTGLYKLSSSGGSRAAVSSPGIEVATGWNWPKLCATVTEKMTPRSPFCLLHGRVPDLGSPDLLGAGSVMQSQEAAPCETGSVEQPHTAVSPRALGQPLTPGPAALVATQHHSPWGNARCMDSRSERGTPFITAKGEGQFALLEKSKSLPPFLFSSLTTWKFNVPTMNFGRILPPSAHSGQMMLLLHNPAPALPQQRQLSHWLYSDKRNCSSHLHIPLPSENVRSGKCR